MKSTFLSDAIMNLLQIRAIEKIKEICERELELK